VVKFLSPLFHISVCTLGFIFSISEISIAQVTSDGTVNTQVTQNGNVAEITGGETRGGNLFHSFQDFSVGTGNEAFFNNASSISNILSRVTGGKISNIDGLIRANGSANLFLINPAGILFGENASLDLGGSFYGSTADSILFPDGTEFSAVNSDNTPILTINAPIGLNLRDNPAPINIQPTAENSTGLQVATGKTLALFGGDINLDGSFITAPGGIVELGGLNVTGTIGITQADNNFTFSFPEGVSKSNISLINGSQISASTSSNSNAGDIKINANDVNLVSSYILSNVLENVPNADERQGGQITLNTSTLSLAEDSEIGASTFGNGDAGQVIIDANTSVLLNNGNIQSSIAPEGSGNGGNIQIDTPNLTLENGAQINSAVFGQGNSGTIDINATKLISLTGLDTAILGSIAPGGSGKGGSIQIDTPNLTLKNGAQIGSTVFGQGNGGTIDIDADSITLDGFAPTEDSIRLSSIRSSVEADGIGNGGVINIDTSSLSLSNEAEINASTFGNGNAGDINIKADDVNLVSFAEIESNVENNVVDANERTGGEITLNTSTLSLSEGSQIDASTFGNGNAGSTNINATESIFLTGLNTSIIGNVENGESGGTGNGGSIQIDTPNLTLENGAQIISAVLNGQGNSGKIDIKADSIILDGFAKVDEDSIRSSGIISGVTEDGIGNGGVINIDTSSLSLSNEAEITTSTFGNGNAGDININANDVDLVSSNIFSNVLENVPNADERTGGEIKLNTSILSLAEGSQIGASTLGNGNAGKVTIDASTSVLLNNGDILGTIEAGGIGNGGSIQIDTPNLTLKNGAQITSSVSNGQGNGGAIDINADAITFEGFLDTQDRFFPSGIRSTVETDGIGNGGVINIDTSSLSLSNEAEITASTSGDGNAGDININADDVNLTSSDIFSDVSGNIADANERTGGEITFNTSTLSLAEGAQISASTLGNGDAGSIDVNATESISLTGLNTAIIGNVENGESGGIGNGSSIYIDTPNLTVKNGAQIISAVLNGRGNGGKIDINADSINLSGFAETEENFFPSGIRSTVEADGIGNGGVIDIDTSSLSLSNGAEINTSNASQAGEVFKSGNIILQVDDTITLDENSLITATASNNNNGGDIKINADFIVAFPSSIPNGGNDILATAENGNGGEIKITANEAILGIEERSPDPTTNDINADSGSGVNGDVFINRSEGDSIQGATQLPENIIEPEYTVDQACSATAGAGGSTVVVKGKGGIPPQAIDPLSSDNIIVSVSDNSVSTTDESTESSKPKTKKITLARGVIVKDDGSFILTPYPTPQISSRLPQKTQCQNESAEVLSEQQEN
jgi:filamentous hemagglutinin family protein